MFMALQVGDKVTWRKRYGGFDEGSYGRIIRIYHVGVGMKRVVEVHIQQAHINHQFDPNAKHVVAIPYEMFLAEVH